MSLPRNSWSSPHWQLKLSPIFCLISSLYLPLFFHFFSQTVQTTEKQNKWSNQSDTLCKTGKYSSQAHALFLTIIQCYSSRKHLLKFIFTCQCNSLNFWPTFQSPTVVMLSDQHQQNKNYPFIQNGFRKSTHCSAGKLQWRCMPVSLLWIPLSREKILTKLFMQEGDGNKMSRQN